MFTGATARNSERIFLEPMHDSMVRLATSSYNDKDPIIQGVWAILMLRVRDIGFYNPKGPCIQIDILWP